MSLRLHSDIWVAAYMRRCELSGAYALLRRKGAAEAGAVAVVVQRRDGLAQLYLPAPQTDFDDDRPADRLFRPVFDDFTAPDAIDARLRREVDFDCDLWIIDVDDPKGEARLEVG